MLIHYRSRWYSDLIIFLLISLFSIFLNSQQIGGPISSITSFLVIFIIPGHAMLSSLFPRTPEWDDSDVNFTWTNISRELTPIEWALISILSSFAISSGALASTYLLDVELGMNATTFISFINVMIISFSLLRRFLVEEGDRFSFTLEREVKFPSWTDKSLFDKITLIIVSSIIIVIAALSLVLVQEDSRETNFTEFYILNSEGLNGDYPSSVEVGNPEEVLVGIRNNEGRLVNYTLVITNIQFSTDSNENRSIGETPILLNEKSSTTYSIPDDQRRQFQVEIDIDSEGLWLFRADLFIEEPYSDEEPYRTVFLWVSAE